MRASGRLFAIDSVTFTGADAPANTGLINATLAVTGFAFGRPVVVPADGAAADGTPVGAAQVDPPAAEAATP